MERQGGTERRRLGSILVQLEEGEVGICPFPIPLCPCFLCSYRTDPFPSPAMPQPCPLAGGRGGPPLPAPPLLGQLAAAAVWPAGGVALGAGLPMYTGETITPLPPTKLCVRSLDCLASLTTP